MSGISNKVILRLKARQRDVKITKTVRLRKLGWEALERYCSALKLHSGEVLDTLIQEFVEDYQAQAAMKKAKPGFESEQTEQDANNQNKD